MSESMRLYKVTLEPYLLLPESSIQLHQYPMILSYEFCAATSEQYFIIVNSSGSSMGAKRKNHSGFSVIIIESRMPLTLSQFTSAYPHLTYRAFKAILDIVI